MSESNINAKIPYRLDIDGIRAFSLIAVILFHAKLEFFDRSLLPGGFLAVEIFFVISGFLIASIILKSIHSGRFSLRHFYERRVRRLFPALIIVLSTFVPVGLFLMSQSQLKSFSEINIAVLLFGSNFIFSFEDQYFASASQLRPYLHTWTLAIEEQFYLVIPLLMMFIVPKGRKFAFFILGLIALASLALAQWGSGHYPQLAFYLLPFRAWELLAGILLAFYVYDRAQSKPVAFKSAMTIQVMPIVGLAMVCVPMVIFDETLRHPSLLTLIPVIGTVCLLYFHHQRSWVTRILSTNIMVWIGKLSYSFYLWHFAIFAFVRIQYGLQLTYLSASLSIALALALSILTYRFVETPFRNFETFPTKKAMSIIATGFVAILAVNAVILLNDGPKTSIAATELIQDAKRIPPELDGKRCRDRTPESACFYDFGTTKTPIILMGDSHAEALGTSLIPAAKTMRRDLTLLLEGGCPLFPRTYRIDYPAARQQNCLKQAQSFQDHLAKLEPSIIIYFVHMQAYLGHDAFTAEDGTELKSQNTLIAFENEAYSAETLRAQANKFFDPIIASGHQVIIVGPVPWMTKSVPAEVERLDKAKTEFSPEKLAEILPKVSITDHNRRAILASSLYASLAQNKTLKTLDPIDLFCDRESSTCQSANEKGLFYADDNHLSPYGTDLIVEKIQEIIE